MAVFAELRRRNVFRVGLAYLIAAWLMLQVVDIIVPILEIPAWVPKAILLVLVVAFPIALILAWAYELTPEGVKREKDVDRSRSITTQTGRKIDFVIIGILCSAVVVFALDKFVWSVPAPIETTVMAGDPPPRLDKSIAVLPFANRSAEESDAYFVDGIHDDILTQLHKLSGLTKVISRTSMERYRDTDLSIPQIADELGVATILEGSVQRAGNRVRVTVQLIEARDDQHLWAENYDRELTTENVFDIQSEIASAIAEQLQSTLTVSESDRLNVLPTTNIDAYDAYLLGKHDMNRRNLASLASAEDYFQRAIELDPEFALAYVGLADSKILTNVFASITANSVFDREDFVRRTDEARLALLRALEIDGELGEVYASLGYLEMAIAGNRGKTRDQVERATSYFERARTLAPNYADLYRWHAQVYQFDTAASLKSALTLGQKAVELDPMFAANHVILSLIYASNDRMEDARRSVERTLEIDPEFSFGKVVQLSYFQRADRYDELILAASRRLTESPGSSLIPLQIASAYAQLGSSPEFNYWAEQVRGSGNPFAIEIVDATDELMQGNYDAAARRADRLSFSFDVFCQHCFRTVLENFVRRDDPEGLLEFARGWVPNLLETDDPVVGMNAFSGVIPVVWALRNSGDSAQADRLLQAIMETMGSFPRKAGISYGIGLSDVEAYAFRGEHERALSLFRQAVDEGWRERFWLASPFLDPIRDDPRFVADVRRIEADLAAQYERLQALAADGSLPPVPD